MECNVRWKVIVAGDYGILQERCILLAAFPLPEVLDLFTEHWLALFLETFVSFNASCFCWFIQYHFSIWNQHLKSDLEPVNNTLYIQLMKCLGKCRFYGECGLWIVNCAGLKSGRWFQKRSVRSLGLSLVMTVNSGKCLLRYFCIFCITLCHYIYIYSPLR